jgi:adenosylcobinamide-GDP ribazoletransferase
MNAEIESPKPSRIPAPLKPIVTAFGMYSRIPMPYLPWESDSMAFAMIGFPLVGVAIGAVIYAWHIIASRVGAGMFVRAGVTLLIPYLVAGGIHLDGFCDTADALASHRPREQKLMIMKDSRVGAFAVITLGLYLVTAFALLCEIRFDDRSVIILAVLPALSRSMSGFAAVTFKNARNDGILVTFASTASTNAVRIGLVCWFVVSAAVMIIARPVTGAAVVLASLAAFGYYLRTAYREFGGITGDLAGWFLTLCEWFGMAGIVAAQWIL